MNEQNWKPLGNEPTTPQDAVFGLYWMFRYWAERGYPVKSYSNLLLHDQKNQNITTEKHMNDQVAKMILSRLTAIEARLGVIEGEGDCGCDSPAAEMLDAQYKAVAVGELTRNKISDDLFICAQMHEIPTFKERGVPHSLVTSWLENKGGTRLGQVTCSCTSGGCSVSKTCNNGSPSCNCVTCSLSCS